MSNKKSIILESLLVISIILGVLSIFFKYIILNETTYLNIFSESGTYDQLKDSIYKKIDGLLNSKNINIGPDIKEFIITDEDIKKETDNAVHGILEYLKTGENNVKPPDTSVYKQRVSDTLDSMMNNIIKPSSGDLSLNDSFQVENMVSAKGKLQISTMNYVKEPLISGQDTISVEPLMSKGDAEAKIREILKQKGLTEEQAIEKAAQKGITEEQALKMLESYGIKIDDYESSESNSVTTGNSNNEVKSQDSNDSNSQDSNNSKSQESVGSSNNEETEKEVSSNNENQNNISKTQDNVNVTSPLDNIKNKLVDEAGAGIDKEVEKMDFSKVLESSKFQKLAKITSTIYKLFWLFITMPIVIMAILIKINSKGLNSSLNYIGAAFSIAGLILALAAFSVYFTRLYQSINIGPSYIKDTISNIVRYNLMVLLKYGVITLVIGLFMFIPTIKKRVIK